MTHCKFPTSPHSDPTAKDAGVSLLEILVVLAIIAMIATLAAPRLLDSFGKAKSHAAEVQMVTVEDWDGPYLDEDDIRDPWGRAFLYRFPGQNRKFDLQGPGRDGRPNGATAAA